MKYLLSLIPLLAIHWAALISPGPNFVLVTQTAIAKSRLYAVMVSMGIATGGFFWCLSALTGLSFLFTHFASLRLGLQILGGAYLCYLAWKLWKNADKKIIPGNNSTTNGSLKRAYFLGLSTNLTNPKTAVYFASILPTFLPEHPSFGEMAVIQMLVFFSSILWHVILALGFSHRHIQSAYLAAKKWVDRFCGTALGLFGFKLLLWRS